MRLGDSSNALQGILQGDVLWSDSGDAEQPYSVTTGSGLKSGLSGLSRYAPAVCLSQTPVTPHHTQPLVAQLSYALTLVP